MTNELAMLLEIESKKEILDFKFKYEDTLVWPFIRIKVLKNLRDNNLFDKKNVQMDHDIESRKRFPFYSVIKRSGGILRQIFVTPFYPKNKTIAFFLNGKGDDVIGVDGKLYNRIFDHFIKVFPLESYSFVYSDENIGCRYETKRKYINLEDFIVEIKAYFTKVDKQDFQMAQDCVRYLQSKSKYEISQKLSEEIIHDICFYSKLMKHQKKMYKKIIEKINPQMVIIECGYYGSKMGILLKVLSELGVPSVEVQHGFVDGSHYAYNYADNILASEEYKEYIPDYFCTWGDYWQRQISIPGKKVKIGNPQFWIQYNKYKNKNICNRKRILWIDFYDLEKSIKLVDEFLKIDNNQYEIIVRTHPLRSERKERYCEYLKYPNFKIDDSQTIYDALAKCDFVVVEFSTVIYEALSFGKTVLAYNDAFSRFYKVNEIVETFDNINELRMLLKKTKEMDEQEKMVYQGMFFETKWEDNYRNLVKHIKES